MKLLTLIVTLSSATVALSRPVPKAPKWEHPKIDDMTPFECAVTPLVAHRSSQANSKAEKVLQTVLIHIRRRIQDAQAVLRHGVG